MPRGGRVAGYASLQSYASAAFATQCACKLHFALELLASGNKDTRKRGMQAHAVLAGRTDPEDSFHGLVPSPPHQPMSPQQPCVRHLNERQTRVGEAKNPQLLPFCLSHRAANSHSIAGGVCAVQKTLSQTPAGCSSHKTSSRQHE